MIEKKYKIEFAPIQGYTDFIYRRVHAQHFGGVNSYYTPFLRVPLRNKDIKDVALEHNNRSLVVPQVLGGNREDMTFLFDYLRDLGYKRVDINWGCPFRKIADRGYGSGAFKNIKHFATLLQLPEDLEISIKIRLGWDNVSQIVELLPFLNDIKFHSLTIHARLGIQGYKGSVDLDSFEKVYANSVHPLFYNGDITTVEEAQSILRRFPHLEGLMIGRGLLADPSLAARILNPESFSNPEARINKYRDFHNELVEAYSDYLEGGELQIVQKLQTIWDYFLPQIDKKNLKKIKKTKTLSDYRQLTNNIFSSTLLL